MRIKSRVIGAIGIVSLLFGFLLLASPNSYEVGGGCQTTTIDSLGAHVCSGAVADPSPELNYPLFISGLVLTILGTVSMAIFLYRRWWLENPPSPESEMENA